MLNRISKNVSAARRSPRRGGAAGAALAIVALLASASSTARADTPAPATAAPAPASTATPDAGPSDSAKKHFAAGVVLLRDPKAPRYEEAYREFKAAYAATPSPRILGNLGLCALQLERDQEALDAYERYLREVPDIDAAERDQVERDLLALRAGLVRLRVTSDPPGATLGDMRTNARGERVANGYGPLTQQALLGLRQGRHVITAHLPGYADVDWEFESSGGDLGAHVFQFKPVTGVTSPATTAAAAAPPLRLERPLTTPVLVGAIVTVVLAGTATVVGVNALSKHSDFQASNGGSDPAASSRLRDDGQRLNVIADVFTGLTIVSAAVTTVLYLTRPSVEVVGSKSPGERSQVAQGVRTFLRRGVEF